MPDVKELRINGAAVTISADDERSLLGVLRDDLGLTGAKYGCGEGRCGACTVVIDGRAVRSCQTSLVECVGKPITTIEGLERDGKLHPLQEAFLSCGAMQCGYCTPGMIMNSYALLGKKQAPTTDEIVQAMEGNICRCGTYARIIRAVSQAAEVLRSDHKAKPVSQSDGSGKTRREAATRATVKGGAQ
jgi:aerobic-type carbon monoxide dehydrogenase small subunit (CoxS/CutS family)